MRKSYYCYYPLLYIYLAIWEKDYAQNQDKKVCHFWQTLPHTAVFTIPTNFSVNYFYLYFICTCTRHFTLTISELDYGI